MQPTIPPKTNDRAPVSDAASAAQPHVSIEAPGARFVLLDRSSLVGLEPHQREALERSAVAIDDVVFLCVCGERLKAREIYASQITFAKCRGCRNASDTKAKQAGMVQVYDCTLGKMVWKKPGQLKGLGAKKRT